MRTFLYVHFQVLCMLSSFYSVLKTSPFLPIFCVSALKWRCQGVKAKTKIFAQCPQVEVQRPWGKKPTARGGGSVQFSRIGLDEDYVDPVLTLARGSKLIPMAVLMSLPVCYTCLEAVLYVDYEINCTRCHLILSARIYLKREHVCYIYLSISCRSVRPSILARGQVQGGLEVCRAP
jgi:hypothetical protein